MSSAPIRIPRRPPGTIRGPETHTARRPRCINDDPVVVMRDLCPPHEPCFHFMRRDVVVGTVYWDDGLPCATRPPRPRGWFAVVAGSDVHDEAPVGDRSDRRRDAIRARTASSGLPGQ